MNLNHLTIPSLDLEQSVEFYQTLDLKLIVRALPHYVRFECPDKDSTFSIRHVEELPDGNGVWLYFEVQDVDQTIENLLKKGIYIEEMPEDKSWLWKEAKLRDPDGNQIIIYHAGENRKNPPWRISD